MDLIASVAERRALIVCNKSDLSASPSNGHSWGEADTVRTIRTSALTGQGMDDLRSAILELVQRAGSGSDDGMLTNMRHHQAITNALESLKAAMKAVSERTPHEMLLLDLYAALAPIDGLDRVVELEVRDQVVG